MATFRYDRRSMTSTVEAAKRSAKFSGKPRFVFATVYGFTVAEQPGPSAQRQMRVEPNGLVVEVPPVTSAPAE